MHWKIHRRVSVESEVTHGAFALQLTNHGAKETVQVTGDNFSYCRYLNEAEGLTLGDCLFEHAVDRPSKPTIE